MKANGPGFLFGGKIEHSLAQANFKVEYGGSTYPKTSKKSPVYRPLADKIIRKCGMIYGKLHIHAKHHKHSIILLNDLLLLILIETLIFT